MSYDTNLQHILNRFNKLFAYENRLDALYGFLKVVLYSATGLLAILLLEYLFNFGSTTRTVITFVLAGLFFIIFSWLVVYPLLKSLRIFSKPDYNSISLKIGSKYPDVKDELANVIQLVNSTPNGSPELVDAAFNRIYKRVEAKNFTETVSKLKLIRFAYRSIGIAIFIAVVVGAVPALSAAGLRFLNYDKEYTVLPDITFEIKPGNKTVPKGESVEILVKISGNVPENVELYTKSEEETQFSPRLLTRKQAGIFTQRIRAINNSFYYYVKANGHQSPAYKISVINYPIIKSLKLTVTPPAYTRLPKTIQDDNGNISVLKGTRVNLQAVATNKITDARIDFSESDDIKLNHEDFKASARFRVMEEQNYSVLVTDSAGLSNKTPVEYDIKIIEDQYPFIELLYPQKDINLGMENTLPLKMKIADDFGFAGLSVHYRISFSKFLQVSEDYKVVQLPYTRKDPEDEVDYIWDLFNLQLGAEDEVTYFVQVQDNDNVSGPKVSRTKEYKIRVPSLDELFTQADEVQETAIDDMEKTLKEAEELKEELEEISNELRKDDQELTWEEKQKIESAMEKFKNLEEKVDAVKDQLSQMQEDLQENNLLSEETLEKYQELQKLMDEITSENLKNAFDKMQNMLEQMKRNDAQMSFEDMKMNEDAFQKSIERTINLLKRIQVEQKTDEMQKRMQDIMDQQQEIQEQMQNENMSDSERDALEKKQKDISEKMEKLAEEMKKLQEKMKELSDMPNEQMQKMMEELAKQQNEQLSEQAQQMMQEQQMQQSMQKMDQIAQNMESMMKMMQQMQQQMQQQNQMQVMKDMMKTINDVIGLSKQQEKLKEATKGLSPSSQKFNENAERQQEIQRNLDKLLMRLGEMAQKTFAINPEMAQALGEARSNMSQSMQTMQNRNGRASSQSMGRAMTNLNEAVKQMQSAMSQMMQQGGQGSGGMMSLMQQMQQLSGQQMSLNQMTRQLQMQGQLSEQQKGQLQRMAQQQQLIQKSLAELNKEAKESGQSKKMPANLDNILSEMQEVISGMNTQELTDDLVLKQENILSKLLDAQRSINEKDFEKNRKAFSGKNVLRETPPEILFGTEEGRNKLRDELLKAVKEGYSKDYEELIRKYFKALEEKKD